MKKDNSVFILVMGIMSLIMPLGLVFAIVGLDYYEDTNTSPTGYAGYIMCNITAWIHIVLAILIFIIFVSLGLTI